MHAGKMKEGTEYEELSDNLKTSLIEHHYAMCPKVIKSSLLRTALLKEIF